MLSVAIVCRDNEGTIARTLDSVAGLAGEIVAVDSGSRDGTIPILERHRARIIRTEWRGYVATKQVALEACTGDLVLSLDSDESLDPALVAEIRRIDEGASRAGGPPDGWVMNRKVFYRDRPLNHAWQPEHRLRLVRRGKARWSGLDPHDYLELQPGASQAPGCLPGFIRHDSVGTFAGFLRKHVEHATLTARSLHAAGRRASLPGLVTSPVGALLKQLIIKQAWRDGWPGWLAAGSMAAYTLAKHITLIELSRSNGRAEAPRQELPRDGSPDRPKDHR
jgi:glycosyltransferase involved in cell wall biosynthesis